MELRDFKAVAFDFDGTIAKADLHLEARKRAYLKMAEQENDQRYAEISDELHLAAGKVATTPLGINAQLLASQGIIELADPTHPKVISLVEFKKIFYRDLINKGQEEIPGASYFMKRLSVRLPGKIGIVTTAHDWEVAPFIQRYKLNPYIPRSKIVSQEDLYSPENVKPHPEAYDIFINDRFNLKDPAQCLVLEDSPLGIAAAKYAGAVVIGLSVDGKEVKPYNGIEPDSVVASYTELSELLGMAQPSQT